MRVDRSRVEFTEVDGELVALNLAKSSYFAVNGSGAALWRLLADGATYERLCQELVTKYGIDSATAASDVASFLSVLDHDGLLLRDENHT